MDFAKFLDIIENKRLFFPRSDQFSDPYEGVMSRVDAVAVRERLIANGLSADQIADQMALRTECSKSFFVSCWHMNEHESAAMWGLYLKSSEGVAIKSSSKRLSTVAHSHPLPVYVSVVQYVDYDHKKVSNGNAFYPIVHKRMSFAHENELRATICAWDDHEGDVPGEKLIKPDTHGLHVDIQLDELIEKVYVSPGAPSWFGALVEQIIKRYGLEVPVERSKLYERALY
jgi:hypothetical protein